MHHSILIPKISDSFFEKCWKYVYDVKSHAYPKGAALQMRLHCFHRFIKLTKSYHSEVNHTNSAGLKCKAIVTNLSLFLFPFIYFFIYTAASSHTFVHRKHKIIQSRMVPQTDWNKVANCSFSFKFPLLSYKTETLTD